MEKCQAAVAGHSPYHLAPVATTLIDVVAWVVTGIWAYLLLGHGRFWSPALRLPEDPPAPAVWPSVAVVVPARDEAEMLAVTVPGLVAQDYPGPVRVVVVDDASTDGTADAARVAAAGGRIGLDAIHSASRPEGWAGKLWAVHQGVAYASDTLAPEWLLLTDADIWHGPTSLRRLVATAVAGQRDMVSLMARLRVQTGWERLIIPSFVYFFAQLYPFRRVGGGGRTAAAAGGCVLVRRDALQAAGGVESIRNAVIDDVSLARRLKDHGASIWLGFADDVDSVRPYPELGDLWRMVARSAYTQLRYSAVLLVGTVVGLALIYLGPPAALIAGLVTGDAWLAAAGGSAWAIMTATYLPMVRYYRLGWGWAASLPVAAAVYEAMTVDSARRHWQGRGAEWKGRTYEASSNS
jgi:hopene-associated glycosyltransferase HpnB